MIVAAATVGQMLMLTAAIAAAVVWLFFLKLRHPRILIPSLVLWHSLLREERPESWWDRIRRAVSLAIALLIALATVMALGRPRTTAQATGDDRPATLVVDTSPTMMTKTRDGRTRWEHAKDRARGLIESAGAGVELLDSAGTIVVPAGADAEQKLMALDRMRAGISSRTALDTIVQSQANGRLFLVSDGVASSVASGASPVASGFSPKDLIPVSVFEPADNVGITAFEIREVPSHPGTFEAYLEVVNYSKQSRKVDLQIGNPVRPFDGAQGRRSPSRTIDVAPLEAYRETIDAAQLEPGAVQAEIRSEGDALDLDNRAFAYQPGRGATRVLLVTPGSEYLGTSLALDPSVALTTIAPKDYRDGARADVFVFDRFVPPAAPSGPVLFFGLPAVPWLDGVGLDLDRSVIENPPVTHARTDQALMRSVSFRDVAIRRAVGLKIRRPDRADAVASSGDHPLIVSGRSPRKWVLVGFPLEASDFGTQVGLPIFLRNAIAWFSPEQPPLAREPGIVSLAGRVAVTTSEGRQVQTREVSEKTTFEAVPGVYFAQSDGETTPIVVNLTSRVISDVNHSAFQSVPAASASQTPTSRELWPTLLALALVLVIVEWFTYHRRITV